MIVTCSDSKFGKLVSPIEFMSFSTSDVGLSVNTFFPNYEVNSILNIKLVGIMLSTECKVI